MADFLVDAFHWLCRPGPASLAIEASAQVVDAAQPGYQTCRGSVSVRR